GNPAGSRPKHSEFMDARGFSAVLLHPLMTMQRSKTPHFSNDSAIMRIAAVDSAPIARISKYPLWWITMSHEPFIHIHRVSYSDCTVGNHVYHSRYLDIIEVARSEFLRELGTPFKDLQQQGLAFPIIEVRLRYIYPARYDDQLSIFVSLIQFTGLRLGFEHVIKNQNQQQVAIAGTWHVCTSLEERPRRIPKPLSALLISRLGAPTCSDELLTCGSRQSNGCAN
ncbi:MAG: acyl-CoA thioesterase, partial [Pedosphaera sp.]|nr:acyl-CoA thioesterase [Pedosphaera sp.]